MQGKMPGARRRGRSRTAWMDNIMTTRGTVNQNDRGQRGRKYVHDVVNPRIEDG